MAPKAHTAVIDGEKYIITRVDPFDGLRLSTLCSRSVGPLVRSIATSPNIGALVKSIAGGEGEIRDDIEALLDAEADGVTGAVIGRALYEGTIDLAEARRLVNDKTRSP